MACGRRNAPGPPLTSTAPESGRSRRVSETCFPREAVVSHLPFYGFGGHHYRFRGNRPCAQAREGGDGVRTRRPAERGQAAPPPPAKIDKGSVCPRRDRLRDGSGSVRNGTGGWRRPDHTEGKDGGGLVGSLGPALLRARGAAPTQRGWGRRVAHVPSLWGHYRTLSPQFHPPEKAALRCTEMAVAEEAQQEPPAAARAGVWGPQCPGACSADSPSGFCHQSHQSRREPAQPTRTPADPSDFRPADLSNFSPKEAAGDQQVRKTCSRSGECKAQPQRAVTSTRHHGPHRRDRRSRCSRRLFQRRRGNAKRTGGGGHLSPVVNVRD